MNIEPLTIMLIVLAAVAIWAVVEVALTLRKARTSLDEVNKSLDEVTHSATEAIDQLTPVITKCDGMLDDLQPIVDDLPSLVENGNRLLVTADTSLESVNGILGDVSSATGGIAGVGESASRIVNTATSAAVGVVSKVASLGGITIPEGQGLIAKKSADSVPVTPAEIEEPAARKGGYVVYSPKASEIDGQE